MTTEGDVEVINLNVNLDQFNKTELVKPVVILDKNYEMDSSSTTSTNSPIISSQQLEELPTLCACNELISSTVDCSDCGRPAFKALQHLQEECNKSRAKLNDLEREKEVLRHKRMEIDTDKVNLENSLQDKLYKMKMTSNNILSLQHDIKILETKCKEEATQVEKIQQSKENVKRELEDLTQRLFEEADSMIKVEKAEQHILQERNSKLRDELDSVQLELREAQDELKLIRKELERQNENNSSYSLESPTSPPRFHNENHTLKMGKDSNVMDAYTRAQVETLLMHGVEFGLQMDTLEDDKTLMDFNDFIQLSQTTPLRKINSLKYMKYCIREDIEPCLRFGPNPKMASKKILDAILVKTCFVEECPNGFVIEQAERQLKEEATATLWERFTTSSVFLGCQACGREIKDLKARPDILKYRFRISYFDEWACIDRYCRDRLLAVIEFYTFIRYLRNGAYKHRSLHELYQQAIRLKLQMLLAKMGTLPVMLNNCGINSEKIASAFQGEDISNSSSILFSSESVSNIERTSSSTESTITFSTVKSSRTSASSSQ
ncbi:uncharacterized protein BX663DRAFT_557024 [Cokeromyces recurvatus]|uniref:uncharacterized protein n=1 Tax=Cokeromyces recurvatus TaxID=90255 RepID=UPI00221F14C8|nr:uncharacterized protein BX663DRAFT_557024 [Cokeromyces recurvatus]KAI7907777.1 hypothetical protein BX663DRAFT_557024 [Cokeromyces recurvatus]